MVQVATRWWYWVAAVPVVSALWALSALWVWVVVLVVPEASATGTSTLISIPAVALGVPALVAFLVLPLALLVDARALHDAGSDWPEHPPRPAQFAVAADAVILAGVVLFFRALGVGFDTRALGAVCIAAGVLGGSALCVWYLRERRDAVDMPGSFREWREELRAV